VVMLQILMGLVLLLLDLLTPLATVFECQASVPSELAANIDNRRSRSWHCTTDTPAPRSRMV
jgi:hypothetical protein